VTEEDSHISKKKVIAIIDNMGDEWQLFICSHGEDAAIAVWTLVAELDHLKEQINGLQKE